jgi:hypothetical protein
MKMVTLGAFALLCAGIASSPASAAPFNPVSMIGSPDQRSTVVQQVGHRRHWHHRRSDWDVDFGFPLAFGLSAPLYADPYYDYGYYGYRDSGSGHVEYCLDRYRSYDPRTNTFMGYDGLLHECISPYM